MGAMSDGGDLDLQEAGNSFCDLLSNNFRGTRSKP
jgi:hypothetical protein